MKKIMTVMAALSIFFSTITGAAAATLCRTSGGNGAVKLTVNLNEGYVGALDATLELTGKVMLDSMEWDASLAPEYVKKYTYDKNTNTVRLFIATGDVTKNLADENGDIVIGVVKVKAASDKEKFNIGIKGLSVTNMDYEARQITTLENDKTADFTYKLEDLNDNDNSDDNNNDNNGDQTDDKNDNNNNGGNNTGDNNKPNDSDTGSDDHTNPDSGKDEAIKNNLGNSAPEKFNSATGSYESVNTGNETTIIYYLGICTMIVLSVGTGYMVYRKNQKA